MSTSLRRTGAALTLASLAVLGLGADPAAAADDDGWLTVASAAPLFDLANLAPGHTGQTSVTVTNEMPVPARFSLAVVDIRSDDNGCNEPEAESGDTGCGQDEGELDELLLLSLTSGSTAIAERPLADWDVAAADAVTIPAGASRTYELAYELPISASNEIQTDLISFAVDLRLEQAVGDTEVAGVSAQRPRSATVAAAAALPRTGADLVGLVRAGAAVVAIGCLLTLVADRRRLARVAVVATSP